MLKGVIKYEDGFGPWTKVGGAAAYCLEDALDRWLRTEFDILYRDVLDEPLPGDIETLARHLQARLDEKEADHGNGVS